MQRSRRRDFRLALRSYARASGRGVGLQEAAADDPESAAEIEGSRPSRRDGGELPVLSKAKAHWRRASRLRKLEKLVIAGRLLGGAVLDGGSISGPSSGAGASTTGDSRGPGRGGTPASPGALASRHVLRVLEEFQQVDSVQISRERNSAAGPVRMANRRGRRLGSGRT